MREGEGFIAMLLELDQLQDSCCDSPHEACLEQQFEVVREQFDDLTRPLIRHLLGHARSILHSEDLAWDAVQEALLGLWEKAQSGAAVLDYAGPWLCRAVVLRSLQIARQNGRRSRHERRAAACRSDLIPCAIENDVMETEELRRIVSLAVAVLPDDFRSVLELRTQQGLDYAGISRQLGIPLGTVRSRLNRARLLLQNVLENSVCELLPPKRPPKPASRHWQFLQ